MNTKEGFDNGRMSEAVVNNMFGTNDDEMSDKDGKKFHLNKGADFFVNGEFEILNKFADFDIMKLDVNSTSALSGGNSILESKIKNKNALDKQKLNNVIADIYERWEINIAALKEMHISTAILFNIENNSVVMAEEALGLRKIKLLKVNSSVFNSVPYGNLLEMIPNDKQVDLMKVILELLFFIKNESEKNFLAKSILTVGVIGTMSEHKSFLKNNFYQLSTALDRNCMEVSAFIASELLQLNS